MIEACETCEYYRLGPVDVGGKTYDGECSLSEFGKSELMYAAAEVGSYDAILCVSRPFGCNQHKIK